MDERDKPSRPDGTGDRDGDRYDRVYHGKRSVWLFIRGIWHEFRRYRSRRHISRSARRSRR